jgi:hypothetical protein
MVFWRKLVRCVDQGLNGGASAADRERERDACGGQTAGKTAVDIVTLVARLPPSPKLLCHLARGEQQCSTMEPVSAVFGIVGLRSYLKLHACCIISAETSKQVKLLEAG